MKRLNADPAFKAAARDRIARLHADPAFAAKLATAASRSIKRLNSDPAFAAAARERMKHMQAERRRNCRRKDRAAEQAE